MPRWQLRALCENNSVMTLHDLPALNAGLNGTSAILLTGGFLLIKRKHVTAHRAAMLAASARLGVPVECLAEEWVRPQATFEPDAQRHAHYGQQFLRYERLYQAVRGLNR